MNLDTLNAQYTAALRVHTKSSGIHAASLLDLCEVVWNARFTLNRTDYYLFLRRNDLFAPENDKVTARRKTMELIGKDAARLKPYAESIPPSLSSLRHLVRVPDDTLREAVESKTLHPLSPVLDCANLVVDSRVTTPKARRSTKVTPGTSYAAGVQFVTDEGTFVATAEFYTGLFTPAKGRSVVRTLKKFLDANADALGLQPDVKLSHDLEMALLADERQRQEAPAA